MSKQIDERVVSMEFDNARFERNVATSMSTLDKLKQSLKFTGASKGLENINSAAKNVNMNGLGNAVDHVTARFSALQVMGTTALVRITNQAMATGERMIKALTIDPVKTGLQEYETQINAVQTILANTQKEGTNVEIVNKALDELNTYADKTIYNFTEMTRNIGTFTAAGVKLDTSVNAIKGIANLAAVSGSTSQQASTAMYQLSQALAAGKVQLMDWNSVVNAGMGGQVFQDALVRTSENLKTGAKEAINTYGSFRESLTKSGWLTTEVLTETLNQLAGVYSKSELMAQGYSETQAEEIMKLAETAEAAATQVKTFTQLWDVMKEAAQSGWAQTWRLIIGDFEEAKALFTPLADFFTGENGIITKMSDARNALLESALGKGFSGLADKISLILQPAKQVAETVEDVTDKIGDLGEIVDKVINGDFGNGQTRYDKLTEMGYNWMEVQNKVNETLNNSHRYTKEQIAAQDELLGSNKKTAESTSETEKETKKLTEAQKNQLKKMAKMTEEQMRSAGYTEDQIAAMKELGKTAEKLGIPLDEFIDNLDEINGRWLLLNSFKNIGQAFIKVFSAIGQAWRGIFEPIQADQVFNAIAAFHKFTSTLILSDTNVELLTRTFKGLFAVLDIVTTIVGGGAKFAFKALTTILGAFDMNILDLTAKIGDMLVGFRDWLFEQNFVVKRLQSLIAMLPSVVAKIKEWGKALLELPAVQNVIEKIKNAFEDLKNIDLAEVGTNIIEGLKNGLDGGIGSVIDIVINIGKSILTAICDVLGIHSPSTEAENVGTNFIDGLVLGLQNGVSKVWEFLKELGSGMVEFLSNIDWGKVFAVGASVVLLSIAKKLANIAEAITSPLGGVGDVLESVASVITGFSKVLKGLSFNLKTKGIKNLAVALAILVGAVVVLTFVDTAKLWNAVGVVTVLAGVLVALAIATEKISKSSVSIGKDGAKVNNLTSGLLGIAAAILLLGITVKLMSCLKVEEAVKGFVSLTLLMVEMGLFLKAYTMLAKDASMEHISQVGKMMIKLSVSLLLMIAVFKLVDTLSAEEVVKGTIFIAAFTVFVKAIANVAKDSGANVGKVGGLMIKLAIAMGLMVGVIKLIDLLSPTEMLKGVAFAAAFTLFVRSLVKATTIGNDQQIAKLGWLVLSVSTSMLLMAGVVKIIGNCSWGELAKGAVGIAAFGAIIYGLIEMVKRVGPEAPKLAGTILAMSVSIALIAGVAIVLSLVDLKGLAKGIVAVGLLGAIMSGMVLATKGANEAKGNIIAMTVAIAIMAASVVALSFIDTKKLAVATAAIGTLMGMFALMANAAGKMEKSMATIIVMTAVVGALAGVLFLMSGLNPETSIKSVAALSTLMISMAGVMVIVSKAGLTLSGALSGILSLTAMAIPLMALVGVLAVMQNVQNATNNAICLAGLASALVVMLIPLTLIGGFAGAALLGVLSLTAMAVPLLAFVGVLAVMSMVPNAIANALVLSALMETIGDVLFKISLVAPLAVVAVASIAALSGVMVAVGVLATAVGALMEKFPGLQSFLDTGIPVLEQLAYAVGSLVGNLVAGFSESVMTILPALGTTLSQFMTNVTPFIDGVKMVDSSVLTGVGILSGVVLALVAADLIAGISSFLQFGSSFADLGTTLSLFAINATPFFDIVKTIDASVFEGVNALSNAILKLTASDIVNRISSGIFGEDSLATFGTQLKAFGTALVDFSNIVKGNIDETAVTAAASAGSMMAEMQSKIVPSGGVIQWFTGEKNMAEFGSQLVSFGTAIVSFSNTIKGNIDETAITAAASAGTLMAEMQSKIVPTGGVVQWFTGEKDMALFGIQLVAFGDAIVGFSKKVSENGGINEEAVTAATNAGTLMAELQKTIEPTGGVIDFFTGTDDLATFGAQIKSYGEAIVAFSDTIKGKIDEESVTAAANAGTIMADLQRNIPEDKWLDGKADLSDFGSDIVDFGESISDYSEEVSGLDTETVNASLSAARQILSILKSVSNTEFKNLEDFDPETIGEKMHDYADEVEDIDTATVASSVASARKLITLINLLNGLDTSGISNFKVTDIGKSMKSYSDSVSGLDTGSVSGSVATARSLVSLIRSLAGLDTSGVSSFKSAIEELGSIQIDKISKAFSGAMPKMLKAGSNLIEAIARGMKSKQSALTSSVTTTLSSMYKAITSKSSAFLNGGKMLVTKLIQGIKSRTPEIKSTFSSAVSSAANAVSLHSGTFYTGGENLAQGLINGMNSKINSVYWAGYSLGAAAARGEKDGQKSNSPSKLTYQAGVWLGEGLVNGIFSMVKAAYNAGNNLGETTADSISSSMSKIPDILNGGMDIQPTIRPVLDLSDVQYGANEINGLFNRRVMVGAMANIGAISSMMNANQNGNDDVVSAINKLRKDLGNVGNTSYTINGISYDDDSSVTEAIRTIVGAARRERRS